MAPNGAREKFVKEFDGSVTTAIVKLLEDTYRFKTSLNGDSNEDIMVRLAQIRLNS